LSKEDLVQDVLLTVHRVRRTYDPERPIAPWFYAIVQSRFADACRRQRRRAHWEVATDGSAFDLRSSNSNEARHPRADEVAAALRDLPWAQRRIIQWLKLEDLSVREIAKRLRMRESAVKVAAHRGYEAIRRRLGVRQRS
jgi:RNA polymerase sigma-70 factor, ECF subfamily